jgi:RNA polymerase sigma factor (sigma-70 family)
VISTPLTAAQSKLLADNRGYAYWLVAKAIRQRPDLKQHADDLVQEAFLGMVYAARSWRPDGGAKFITYAMFPTRKAIWRAVGRLGLRSFEVPFAEEACNTASENNAPDRNVFADQIAALAADLSDPLTVEAFMSNVLDNAPAAEFSGKAGITPAGMRARLRDLRGKLLEAA